MQSQRGLVKVGSSWYQRESARQMYSSSGSRVQFSRSSDSAKKISLQVGAFLGEVEHELLTDAPHHSCAQPNRVIGLVDDRAVVVEVDAVSGYSHAHSVPTHIRARVVQIEEIVLPSW